MTPTAADRRAAYDRDGFVVVRSLFGPDDMREAAAEADRLLVDFEHLKSSDLMISRTRRRLFGAVEALVRDGTAPPAVDNPDVCNGARGGDYLADEKLGFVETYREQIAKIDPSPALAK